MGLLEKLHVQAALDADALLVTLLGANVLLRFFGMI